MSDREYPRRCPICLEELWSDQQVVEHVEFELRRAEERLLERAIVLAQQEALEAETRPATPHSLGRLFEERIMAQWRLDPYQLVTAGPEQMEAIRERVQETLYRYLTQYVEPWGVDLPRESVYVIREDRFLDPIPSIRFEATWSPDPTRGCAFRGGPMDGEVMPMPRADRLGRPMRDLVRAVEPRRLWHATDATTPLPTLLETVRYRLAGIDPDVDQWVYAWQH